MSFVTSDIKRAVLQEVSVEHGLTEANLETEWDKYVEEPSGGAETLQSGDSISNVKGWFLSQLKSHSIIGGQNTNSYAGNIKSGPKTKSSLRNSSLGISTVESPAKVRSKGSKSILRSSSLGVTTAANRNSRGSRSNVSFSKDTKESVDDVNTILERLERQTKEFVEGEKLRSNSEIPGFDLISACEAEYDKLQRKKKAGSSSSSSSSSITAFPSESDFELAEQKILDNIHNNNNKHKFAKSLKKSGHHHHPYHHGYQPEYDYEEHHKGEDEEGEDEEGADEDTYDVDTLEEFEKMFPALDIKFEEEELEKSGNQVTDDPLLVGISLKRSVVKYILAKSIANWALRHIHSEAYDVYATGILVGAALAEHVFKLDNKERYRKRRPITNQDVKNRHSVITHIFLEGIYRAGNVSDISHEYSTETFLKLHDDIEMFSKQFTSAVSHEKTSLTKFKPAEGAFWNLMKSMKRGSGRKLRALANNAQIKAIIKGTLSIANTVIPGKKEPRGISGYGIEMEADSHVKVFGKQLQHELSIHGSKNARHQRVARNDEASKQAMNLMAAILFGFITNRRLHHHAPDLIAAADTRIEQIRPDLKTDGHYIPSHEKEEVSESAIALQNQIVTKARTYLAQNPKDIDNCGTKYALMVPGNDLDCMEKVKQLLNGPDGGTKFVRGALLYQHPKRELDQQGYLLSISGQLRHLSKIPTGEKPVVSKAKVKLSLMQYSKDGKPELQPDRVPFDVVTARAIPFKIRNGKDSISMELRPLIYYRHD